MNTVSFDPIFSLRVIALLAGGALAYALTTAYHAAFGALASHAYCATLRTGVLTGTALLLAWAGVEPQQTQPGISSNSMPRLSKTARVER